MTIASDAKEKEYMTTRVAGRCNKGANAGVLGDGVTMTGYFTLP